MLGCSARELSEASGISPAVISRYRSSARKPASESPQIKGLADGSAALAKSKGIDMNQSEISEQLEASLQDSTFNYETMRDNLNTLISSVDINISELARFLNTGIFQKKEMEDVYGMIAEADGMEMSKAYALNASAGKEKKIFRI